MRCTDIFSMSFISYASFLLVFYFSPYTTLILYLRFMIWILLISKATQEFCSLPFILLLKAGKCNGSNQSGCPGYTTGLKCLPLKSVKKT